MNRIKALVIKDFYLAKNSVKSLLFMYLLYIFIIFLLKNIFRKFNNFSEGMTFFIVSVLFIQLGLLFMMSLLSIFVYRESTIGKEETYFAYDYKIYEVCIGKSIVLTFLSIIIPYFLIFFEFSYLLKNPYFLLNIFILLPLIFLLSSYLIVLFSWFTKLGMALYFMVFFGVFFSLYKGLEEIIKLKFSFSIKNITLIEVVLIFLFLILSWVITKFIKEDKLIESLS